MQLTVERNSELEVTGYRVVAASEERAHFVDLTARALYGLVTDQRSTSYGRRRAIAGFALELVALLDGMTGYPRERDMAISVLAAAWALMQTQRSKMDQDTQDRPAAQRFNYFEFDWTTYIATRLAC